MPTDLSGQPTPGRLASIDIFRGLTMLVMIFVNDLDSVKGLPWWTYHMGKANGMTYVDMVFPTFLVIVGMSVPYAIGARLRRQPSQLQLWLHILSRTLSLLVLGLILANAWRGDKNLLLLTPAWWSFTALIAAFLFWNAYPRDERLHTSTRVCRLIGIVTLVILFAAFRRTPDNGRAEWLDFSYWEILGIIGWAYLSACILYVPTRRWTLAPLAWCTALLLLNIASTAGSITWPSLLPPYVWPFENGSSCLLVMVGVVITQIFSGSRALQQKLLLALSFAMICLAAGALLSPLGISKIKATPTWCLYSTSAAIIIYTALYWLCDVKGRIAWATVVKPAGSNTLTTYLIPDLIYFAIAGLGISEPFFYGWPGVIRALVFTFVMLGLSSVFTKAKIRLHL
jgi:heparan-alpha-glucosaminide N-acetyltransferase